MIKSFYYAIVTSFFIAFFSGCQTAQMAFPGGTDKSGLIKTEAAGRSGISNRSGKFTLGTMSVSWESGSLLSGLPAFKFTTGKDDDEKIIKTKSEYTLTVNGAEEGKITAVCIVESEIEKDTRKMSNRITVTEKAVYMNKMACAFTVPGRQYQLFIEDKESNRSGYFKGGSLNLEITGSKKVEGASFNMMDFTGYYITDNGKFIGAVETLNSGSMYISKNANKEQMTAVKCIAAALLKYSDPAR